MTQNHSRNRRIREQMLPGEKFTQARRRLDSQPGPDTPEATDDTAAGAADSTPPTPWLYPLERPRPTRTPRNPAQERQHRTQARTAWRCWTNPTHPTGPHPVLGWPHCAADDCTSAPAYHERWDLCSHDLVLNLYAPPTSNPQDPSHPAYGIAPTSAVLGVPDDPTVYFEGFIHGHHSPDATPFTTWVEAIAVAASRLVTVYPTVAKTRLPAGWTTIGRFHPATGLIEVTDPDTLGAWINGPVPHPYTRHR